MKVKNPSGFRILRVDSRDSFVLPDPGDQVAQTFLLNKYIYLTGYYAILQLPKLHSSVNYSTITPWEVQLIPDTYSFVSLSYDLWNRKAMLKLVLNQSQLRIGGGAGAGGGPGTMACCDAGMVIIKVDCVLRSAPPLPLVITGLQHATAYVADICRRYIRIN